jgi:hypothetical protein
VTARHFIVGDDQIDALAPDHNLPVALDALPLTGTGGDLESRHRCPAPA